MLTTAVLLRGRTEMMHAAAPLLSARGLKDRPPRKNLLLAASIEAEGLKVQVRIRNLSENGAMIDGSVLPRPGTMMTLRRTEIEVGARVVWQAEGRCGVAFDASAVTVEEWVSGKRTVNFAKFSGQERVDAIQEAVRSGATLPTEAPPSAPADLANLGDRLVEEIHHVRELLDSLGERLTDDPHVIAAHMESLQNLDRASQILDHLGAILGANDPAAAVDAVAMQELRERLMR